MAHRKEVFQSKVLQRLYPPSAKPKEEPSPTNLVESLAKKKHVKRKTSGGDSTFGDAGKTQSAAKPGSRVYTVLPPPEDYNIHSEKSVTLAQQEGINSVEDPAEDRSHGSTEELGEVKEPTGQKRRRRRKRKPALQQDFGKDGSSPVRETSTGQSQTSVGEGGDHISRNKKRKLKKKRHKERLLSMGLMPRAAALEFTYQKDGEEDKETKEDVDERRIAEVSDFLKSIIEIYLSDSSLQLVKIPHLSATVAELLGGIKTGCKPNSVLIQLYSLKVLVQQNDADKLQNALKELGNNSAMSAEETAAVVSLFQYWITDILPMQRDKKASISTTNPRLSFTQ